MKRRDVIKLGAVAAGAALGPSCALPQMVTRMKGAKGADDFNSMLDTQLGMLERPGLLQRIVSTYKNKPLSTETQTKINAHDEMFRRMLSTILLTQSFRDLPLDTQLQPTVQDRMWKHADLIGGMVFEASDMLGQLDETKRKQVQTMLQADPDLPMFLGETLDEKAGMAGISRKRRKQLRAMMRLTSFRLQKQHPGIVIDEYVRKIEKFRASNADDARAIDLAEQLSEREFWRRQRLELDDQVPTTGGGSTPAPAAPTGAPPTTTPGTPPANPMVIDLTANARAAAQAGDCRKVAQLGRYVSDLDPEYFKSNFRSDPELRACLQKIAIEDAPKRPVATPSTAPGASQPEPTPPHRHPGAKGLRVGGWMLGIAVIIFIVSLPLAENLGPGLIGLTIAVLLGGIALLVLLISALIYATND